MFWFSLLFLVQFACRHQLLEPRLDLHVVNLIVLRCLRRRSIVSLAVAWFLFGGGSAGL